MIELPNNRIERERLNGHSIIRRARQGFTLLELLVVVGIMGMLGVAAMNGYSQLKRGMADRGAVAVAATLLRAAQERAHVDRQPTVVFCYNRLLKAPTGVDDNGVAVGVMTAIRRAGRISNVKGDLLFDEFADLDTTYESVTSKDEAKKGGGRRLFKFPGGTVSKMEYSLVSDRVYSSDSAELLTLFSDRATNLFASAFCDKGGSRHAPSDSWSVGDGYGFEFAEMQLPRGYIFGKDVPHQTGDISGIEVLHFDPDSESSTAVTIYRTVPNASGYPTAVGNPAGRASAKSEEAL